MAFETERQVHTGAAVDRREYDEGLRKHMLRVYNYMTGGLALTGVVAYVTANTPVVYNAIYGTPLIWVVFGALLAIVWFATPRIPRMSYGAAQATFWAFSGLFGLAIAYIFLVYTSASITRVFFITSGSFAALSLFGYTTKKDLSGWGSFLFIGLIGALIAVVVNWFLQSPALDFAVSIVIVLVFAGLTAYDTQKIKEAYSENYDHESAGKLAIQGAVNLYLDFLNMFIWLLHLLGVARD